MKNIIQKSGRVLTYVSGGLSVIGFAQGLHSSKQNKTIIDTLNSQDEFKNNIIANQEETIRRSFELVKMTSKTTALSEDNENAVRAGKKIANISEQLKNTSDPSQIEMLTKDLSYHSKNLNSSLHEGSSKIEQLKTTLGDALNSGSNNKYFGNNIIENFQEYLSTLPLEKVGALAHILLCIAILWSIASIVFIFYGDILIRYYKLEERFPKLAKFIQLRRKFQQYYFVIDVSLMVIALLSIIYVNLLVFLN